MKSKVLTLAIATGAFVLTARAQQGTLPQCGDLQVDYTKFNATYKDRIVVSESEASPPKSTLRADGGTISPQGTRWFSVTEPDFTKAGPWNSVVTVAGVGLRDRSRQLRFIDHGSGGVHAQWLNEKLLYLEVWWGRIGSTDLVFDVQSRNFIYKEDANYGATIQPCE